MNKDDGKILSSVGKSENLLDTSLYSDTGVGTEVEDKENCTPNSPAKMSPGKGGVLGALGNNTGGSESKMNASGDMSLSANGSALKGARGGRERARRRKSLSMFASAANRSFNSDGDGAVEDEPQA